MATTYASHYRDQVSLLLQELIEKNRQAEAADNRVAAHIRRLNNYTRKQGYSEHSARDKKRNDYDFQDALDDYRKCVTEVERVSNVLQGIAAAVSLLDR